MAFYYLFCCCCIRLVALERRFARLLSVLAARATKHPIESVQLLLDERASGVFLFNRQPAIFDYFQSRVAHFFLSGDSLSFEGVLRKDNNYILHVVSVL